MTDFRLLVKRMHQIHLFISSSYFCVFRLRESNLPATDLSQAIYFAFFSSILVHNLKYFYLSLCPSVRPSLRSRPKPPKQTQDLQQTFFKFKNGFELDVCVTMHHQYSMFVSPCITSTVCLCHHASPVQYVCVTMHH